MFAFRRRRRNIRRIEVEVVGLLIVLGRLEFEISFSITFSAIVVLSRTMVQVWTAEKILKSTGTCL